MGLPKIDGREGPGGRQLGPPWGVHGQTAAGYGQWVGGLGPNTAPLGTQGGWIGSPSAQGGWGVAGASGGALHQRSGAATEAAPLGLQGNFHLGSGWSQAGSMGPQIGALSGANMGRSGGADPAFGTGRTPEPWQMMGDWRTVQGFSRGWPGGVQGIAPAGERSE